MDTLATALAPSRYESLLAADQVALDAIPGALCLCAADGTIVRFNRRAAELWGRTSPAADSDVRFCGAFQLWHLDGRPLPHDATPMATALRTGAPQQDLKVVVERPDGTRIVVLVNIEPLLRPDGAIEGAVNCFQEVLVDISERKQAGAMSGQLAAIIESSDDAIASKDLNGILVSWNKGAERLFGYTAAEIVGKSVTILIPEDHQDEEPEILARIRRGERVEHYETVRRHKDGTLIDISLSVSPVRDAEGRIVGASKIARDITERKRVEAALASRAEEQAALYELAARLQRATCAADIHDAALAAIQRALGCERAAILLHDEAGAMRFVAWRGLSEEYRRAVEGHSPWAPGAADPQPACIPDTADANLPEPLAAALNAAGIGALAFIPLVAEGKLVGKFMAYWAGPHAFAPAELDLAVAIARQLGFGIEAMRADAARRRAEEELRANATRARARAAELQAIMEAVPAVIWIARDPECRVIAGNRTSFDVLRLPPEANPSLSAPPGERPVHFQVVADGRVLATDELPVQRAARGEEVRNCEAELRFDDGSSRFLLGNARPLRDDAGNPHGAVAAFVDITERKRAEEQRDLLIAELSHRVKNTLATVISVAQLSFGRNPDVAEARRSFDARLRALAQTHGRLAEASWAGLPLDTIVNDELAPYRRDDGANLRIAGPRISVTPKCALMLAMAIHELATNAAKYGALSVRVGTVAVAWHVDPRERQLRFSWVESGGPRVAPPARSGFGRLLLERAVASDLRGHVQLDFAPTGVSCAIAMPLDASLAHRA